MIEFFMTFVVLLADVVIMADGVMRGRDTNDGSCGGLKHCGGDGAGGIVGGNRAHGEASGGVTQGG